MTIDNTADIIDSRDIIDQIEDCNTCGGTGRHETTFEDAPTRLVDVGPCVECASLRQLAAQCQDWAADWECGEQLIRDSYFREYAQELADELGLVPSEYTWPMSCIDWDQAARELRMDYTAVDFDGVTYWVR